MEKKTLKAKLYYSVEGTKEVRTSWPSLDYNYVAKINRNRWMISFGEFSRGFTKNK